MPKPFRPRARAGVAARALAAALALAAIAELRKRFEGITGPVRKTGGVR